MDLKPKPCPYCQNVPAVYQTAPFVFNVQCALYACNMPVMAMANTEARAVKHWNKIVEEIERKDGRK